MVWWSMLFACSSSEPAPAPADPVPVEAPAPDPAPAREKKTGKKRGKAGNGGGGKGDGDCAVDVMLSGPKGWDPIPFLEKPDKNAKVLGTVEASGAEREVRTTVRRVKKGFAGVKDTYLAYSEGHPHTDPDRGWVDIEWASPTVSFYGNPDDSGEARLFAEPSADSKVVYSKKGQIMKRDLLDCDGTWAKVRLEDGEVGWMEWRER